MSAVADWRPCASQEALLQRARMLALVREFFSLRGVQEQQTPCVASTTVSDPNIESISTTVGYLQTSPEFHMKRLLAAYRQDIFQLGKVFRAHEAGKRHLLEFTLLEWYRIHFDWRSLAEEVCELIEYLSAGLRLLSRAIFIPYRDAFMDAVHLDPLEVSEFELRQQADDLGLVDSKSFTRDQLLDFIFSHKVAAVFPVNCVTVVHHYPASQAALARLDPDCKELALRFECYIGDVELANGYSELADASEQLQRFKTDNQKRIEENKTPVAINLQLLAALKHGLPDCSGVALGLDRLLQYLTSSDSISQVVSFTGHNA